ncbi:hypothetical protein FRACYDRAFT_264063 [Fragilariopsis cylindrus CCMP1102]|uniref:Uncharacterized protein n=1 Tax=Fragilariopsis cylindrus CCMP1102 TaxID=635003 RepID=A0A1E7EV66_9STRA|nr:hypothetical protein FRACYDRAFT_264063 [Fragilariopsis cylindrus CCMP1102]|eukprot:OEU09756.1 hypothetical protein FRACYDRAFT_264063 [Fragilariopsis cylindrus CCMP1102]
METFDNNHQLDQPSSSAVSSSPSSPLLSSTSNTRYSSCYHCSSTSSKSSVMLSWSLIQHLNNRGCVHVMKGNYVEANRLFEDAITKYAQMMNANNYNTNNDGNHSMTMIGSSSTASHDFQGRRLRRMTSISQLRTFPYCGRRSSSEDQQVQDQDQDQDQQDQPYRHEVYCLPIVMNEEEWELSSNEEKSFVLIYNTALCNHLWGMELLVSIAQDHQNTNTTTTSPNQEEEKVLSKKLCERAFCVAHKLYRLAHENVVSTFVNGVDQLCYVAIFNNISHVCKTIQGYDSQEANQFDLLLLKAIYWWKDTSDLCSSTTRTNNYADNDIDIIDSFLEHVFYLIGAPCDVAPATAA